MDRFASHDGTDIAFRILGEGRPLVCLSGGPGRAGDYLGDLGGLAGWRQLILPDTRGTGASGDAGPATYRCDRLVQDVEALRGHLGLERFDLLGHSAAGNLAVLYAAAHPERLDHLVLLTPGLLAVGVEVTDEQWRAAMERRSGEPWYAEATAAAQKADADGAFDPGATRAALGKLAAPVLIYAGELDLAPPPEVALDAARLFPHCEVVVQPDAGHSPWLDDPAWFTSAINTFLGSSPRPAPGLSDGRRG